MRLPKPRVVLPGAVRGSLALLLLTPVAIAYPWESTRDRWLIGVVLVLLLALLGWWRGLHVTTILRRRFALTVRNRRSDGAAVDHQPNASRVTVLVTVTSSPESSGGLPLATIASYLDRYGVRCEAIRITSKKGPAPAEPISWIGLTIGAAENLPALQARSPELPLSAMAETAGRRLADHLREIGCNAWIVDTADAPDAGRAIERWHCLDGDGGHLAAYRVHITDDLPETLARIWSHPAIETWTAMEFGGLAGDRTVAVSCALRTADRPDGHPPLAGLVNQRGNHRPVLTAMNPASGAPLDRDPARFGDSLLDDVLWPTGRTQPTASGDATPVAHATQ